MQLWPAVDILQGRCVRLRQGDYAQQTVYDEDPVRMALHWVRQGAQQLHLVDLDGARTGQVQNASVIEQIVRQVGVPCQLGGGIRSQEAIEQWLELGVSRVVLGTRAVEDPQWLEQMARQFPEQVVLGLDAREGQVATRGWLHTSQVSAGEFLQRVQHLPLAGVVYTDIARDGTMQGPNFVAIKQLVEQVPLPVIASGGISSLEDVRRLRELGVAGCIVGRALYQGAFTLPEALQVAAEDS